MTFHKSNIDRVRDGLKSKRHHSSLISHHSSLITFLLLFFCASSFAQTIPVEKEFLPQAKFSPQAFLISGYYHHNKINHRDKALRQMAECYLNTADAADPQNYALCEQLGLSVFVSKGPHLNGEGWREMSDEEIDAYVKDMVEKGGKSKSIIGYYICDEPSATAFPKLAKAVEAIKKYAPGKIAYINLYPNYATLWKMDQIKSQLGTRSYTEYLERFVNEVKPQVISYDNYMVEFSMDLENSKKAESYYTNLLEVRRIAQKYNLPFYNIVSSNQIRPFTTVPSPANLAYQAYTTLAAGAGGIIWYTYHGQSYGYNPLDKEEDRTVVWRYLQEVNRQVSILGPIVKQLKSTGVYFTSPAPVESLPLLPGKLAENVESEDPLMIGEFESAQGNKYIMVVNLNLRKSAKFKLQTKTPNEKILLLEVGEKGKFIETNINEGYWVTAGSGVLIKCSGVASEKDYSVKNKTNY